MTLPYLARQAAEQFKARLGDMLPDRAFEMRVFGSMARGEAHEDSDLDVLVLIDREDDALDLTVVRAALQIAREMDLPFPISPLTMTWEHFEELQRRERLLAREILRDGILV